ncbi:MAG: hypothetical protein RL711_430, partial [Bacteroidota bacterium]
MTIHTLGYAQNMKSKNIYVHNHF